MGGLTAPRDAMALHAERSLDDAERNAERLENRPLLDVEFEVRGRGLELLARIEGAGEVHSMCGEGVRKPRPSLSTSWRSSS